MIDSIQIGGDPPVFKQNVIENHVYSESESGF